MATIRIQNLTKRYGSVLGVDDLSFEVRPGQVTGFLGPNGSGKTTTLLGEPGVLIFDEPLDGLDPDGIRWLRGLLLAGYAIFMLLAASRTTIRRDVV